MCREWGKGRAGVKRGKTRVKGKADLGGKRREGGAGLLVMAFEAPKGLQWVVSRKQRACRTELKSWAINDRRKSLLSNCHPFCQELESYEGCLFLSSPHFCASNTEK